MKKIVLACVYLLLSLPMVAVAAQNVAPVDTFAVSEWTDTPETVASSETNDEDYSVSAEGIEDIDSLDELFDAFGGLMFAGVMVCLLIVVVPIALVILIIYMVQRNQRMKYQMEMRAGSGQTSSQKPSESYNAACYAEYRKRRNSGISTLFTGLGLTIFFGLMFGWGWMIGIGLLIVCIGLGEILTAYLNRRDDKYLR